ncbi:GNS1 SUR4 membrane protein domain containing protein [Aphelenchoides fujianensis]|nr:GNS1 SUR4 membrane protein domain containing protein [Aphelenchoides fujianensis]
MSGSRRNFALPFEHLSDPVHLTYFIQRNWFLSIPFSIFYYTIIRVIQSAMRRRPPFALNNALFYWNAALSVFSFFALVRFSEDFVQTYLRYGFTHTICRTCNPSDVGGFWSFVFGCSKLLELGDTLFIVLRKRPLIFLHYYHHAAVVVYSAHSAAEHAAPAQAYGIMNMFVHWIMYAYYAYRATGKRTSSWIPMAVTTIQTTQMLLGVGITCYVCWLKVMHPHIPCQQSFANIYLAFFLYLTFAVLFIHFFVCAYITKTHHRRKSERMAAAAEKEKKAE